MTQPRVTSSHEPLRLPDVALPRNHGWRRLPFVFGAIAAAAILLAVLFGRGNPKQLLHSYLTAYLFWLSIALGGLFFTMLQFVVRAGWSVVVRRMAENAMAMVPLMAVLFLPIALGAHDLYPWTHAEHMTDPVLQGKAGYLNLKAFYVRAAIYFVVWIALSMYFYRMSIRQDRTGDATITSKLQAASGVGILLFGITLTFAAFDWIMSLDPHWYSTIFGAYYFGGSLVAIFSWLIVGGVAMRAAGLLRGVLSLEHFHDLGKLLFGFTMFWAYLAFSQFFLIWYGNIPEETIWFYHRLEGSWSGLSIAVALGHFVVPFFFLMTRITKRKTPLILIGALWMLAMHYIDMYWLVMPNLHKHGVHASGLDIDTFVALGAIFCGALSIQLRRHALIPHQDPRLPQSLSFENI